MTATPSITPRRGEFRFHGHRLAFEIWGAGDSVLVFLHGLLVDSGINRAMAQGLAAKGHQVVLLDLLGHGQSDKPVHAAEYRIDVYAEQLLGLLDHLQLDAPAIGGTSLGANVSLCAAVAQPERIGGLVAELPVLEWSVPGTALTLIPLVLAAHYARRLTRVMSRIAGRAPRTGIDVVDSALDAVSTPPQVMSAIFHGIMVGPVAPTIDARRALQVPTLVIGHGADYIHPFSDAENLAAQLPHARLVRSRLPFELHVRPRRLVDVIDEFLVNIDAGTPPIQQGDIA